MLRRRTDEPTPPPASSGAAGDSGIDDRQAGKGRPTPKRKEAEARRRKPVGARPANRKEAREQSRQARTELRAALERGDESRMPPRDRGPVRRFARDYIDSRRTLAEFFLPLGVVLYIPLLVAGHSVAAGWAGTAIMVLVLMLVVELVRVGFGLSRALRDRFAAEDRRGAVFYGLTRAGQVRRWRLPRPQVKVGERPDARARR